MTRTSLWLLLAGAVSLAATSGIPIGAAVTDAGEQPSSWTRTGDAVTTDANSSLLTESELFADVVDGSPENHTATLYRVAANGTWYHADADGSVGARAPHGDVMPNVDVSYENGTTANETLDVDEQRLPAYVWKVTREGCGTTAYDAETGAELTGVHVPSCTRLQRGPTPPRSTPGPGTASAEPTPDVGSPTESVATPTDADPPETTTATGPGFGVAFAIVTVALGGLTLGRR